MTSIDLYAMGSPNVLKVVIALEEMGLAYNVIPTDIFAGEQFGDDFQRLNINGKVPVLVDRDAWGGGATQTVFESGAILLYLAEKTDAFMSRDPAQRYEAIQWLMVQMSGVGPMFGQLTHFLRSAPQGNDYALSRYRTQVVRLLDVAERRLAQTPYFAGEAYSVADMAMYPWLQYAPSFFGQGGAVPYAKLSAWVEGVAARPPVQRAMAALTALQSRLTPAEKADPDMVDKITGRGAYAA